MNCLHKLSSRVTATLRVTHQQGQVINYLVVYNSVYTKSAIRTMTLFQIIILENLTMKEHQRDVVQGRGGEEIEEQCKRKKQGRDSRAGRSRTTRQGSGVDQSELQLTSVSSIFYLISTEQHSMSVETKYNCVGKVEKKGQKLHKSQKTCKLITSYI